MPNGVSGLANELRMFVNKRVNITTDGVAQDVIIVEVNDNFVRAVEVCSGNIKVYQLSRIDFVEDTNP